MLKETVAADSGLHPCAGLADGQVSAVEPGENYFLHTAVLEAWAIHMGGNESGSLPHTTHIQNKMMSWVKDLYTKAKLIKFLESNPGKHL